MVLNFPGTEEYDWHRPWVFKQCGDGFLAMVLFIHMNYGQTIGPTDNLCWEAYRRGVSKCSWLSIKDASRKFQLPSQATGPRVCTVTNTEGGVHGLVSQNNWDKTRRLIA